MRPRYGSLLAIVIAMAGCGEGDVSGGDDELDAGDHPHSDAATNKSDASDGSSGVVDAAGIDAALPESPYVVCSQDGWCFDRPRPTSQALHAGARAAERELWLVGEGGTLLHFDGTELRGASSELRATLRAAFAFSARDVWAAGDALSLAHYDGESWRKVSLDAPDGGLGASADFLGLWGASPTDLWLTGSAGALYRYNGTIWVKQASPVATALRAIWGTTADHVVAVGDGGTLVQFDGTSWSKSTLPGGAGALNAVHGISKTDFWVVGAQGRVVHYDGTAFKVVELTLPKVDLYAVQATGANQVVVSGAGGAVYVYDGTMWRVRPSGVTSPLRALVPSDNAELLSVGEHGAVVRWSGEQRTTYSSGSAANYLDAFSTKAGALWVVGDEALRLDEGGYRDVEVESKRSLYDGFALSSDVIWAVGTAGTIVRWDGSRFNLVESGTSSWLRGVWAGSATSAWVVGAKAWYWGSSTAPPGSRSQSEPTRTSTMSGAARATTLGWSAMLAQCCAGTACAGLPFPQA